MLARLFGSGGRLRVADASVVPDDDGDEHAAEEAEDEDFGDDDGFEEGASFGAAWFHLGHFAVFLFGLRCGLGVCVP